MSLSNVYPTVSPKILLDFANTGKIDTRFNVSRSGTGPTVVGSATYYNGTNFTLAEQNLLTYSQIFNNANWTATDLNVTINTVLAPNSTTTASTISASNSNGTLVQSINLNAGTYTFSVWIKRSIGSGNIDITTDSTGTWSTVAVTSTWARYTITQTLGSSGTKTPGIRIATGGDEIYIWGAQLEQRSVATSYIATTIAPITNSVATLVTASDNVPRFQHDPFSGLLMGLLVEESSTNLITYSSDFNNPAWVKTNCTVQSASTVSPDGTLTSNKIYVDDILTSNVFNFFSVSTSTTINYGISVYAKANESSYLFVGFNKSSTEFAVTQFNLSTGTIQFSGTSGSGYSILNSQMIPASNGWFICTVILKTGSTTDNVMISPSNAPWTGGVRPGSGESGNGYSGIQIWGAQLEENFASSYIPTNGSAITRVSDDIVYPGINSSDWFNNDFSTIVATIYASLPIDTRPILSLDDNTINNEVKLLIFNQLAILESKVNGISSGYVDGGTMALNSRTIISAKYKNNNFAITLNTLNAINDNAAEVPVNLTHLRIGSDKAGNNFNGIIAKIAIYSADLTNQQLQVLSAR